MDVQCKSVPVQSQIWHTMWQSCHKWRTISHMWSIFCFTCVEYASQFVWHMVCQIRLNWSQERIIVKHILHNMCQIWLCVGARFTVVITSGLVLGSFQFRQSKDALVLINVAHALRWLSIALIVAWAAARGGWPEHSQPAGQSGPAAGRLQRLTQVPSQNR
jgi:hypothetical protein